MLLCLTIQQGWKTRQVDFTNAFVQSTLKEDVYISLPAMFSQKGSDRRDIILKLKKALYALKQAPLAFFLHLSAGLKKLGFEPGVNEPGIFYGHGMAIVFWVDDCLFFGPNEEKINDIIAKLKQDFTLTEEDTQGDVFTF